jgi:hypothetical protein
MEPGQTCLPAYTIALGALGFVSLQLRSMLLLPLLLLLLQGAV